MSASVMAGPVAVLPPGMVALDDDTVVALACVAAIMRIVRRQDSCDVYTTQVLLTTGGSLTIDADVDEVLRRIAVQLRAA